jgi:hypothetical protein
VEVFGAVLADLIADFESEEGARLAPDDAVQLLALAAHQKLLAETGGQLPRSGGHAYAEIVAPPPVTVRSQLDVKF